MQIQHIGRPEPAKGLPVVSFGAVRDEPPPAAEHSALLPAIRPRPFDRSFEE